MYADVGHIEVDISKDGDETVKLLKYDELDL